MKRFGWVLVAFVAMSSPCVGCQEDHRTAVEGYACLSQADQKGGWRCGGRAQAGGAERRAHPQLNEQLGGFGSRPVFDRTDIRSRSEKRCAAAPGRRPAQRAGPDAAAQKAILDKAFDYATKTFAQLPHLTATRTTARFQDNVEVVKASSGMHSSASTEDPSLVMSSQFVHYINSTDKPVELANGAEVVSTTKDKTPWGMNGYVVMLGLGPVLSTVLQEAQAAGKIEWLRWELVNGKQAAVFSFSVDKKKTHYTVNYCCFPDSEQAGRMSYSAPSQGNMNPVAKGNMQTTTDWHPFKSTVPYHGEFFVDPDTGIVVRLITQAEFKTSDVVHQEDQRIDYLPVTVGGKALVLPVKTVANTEVVPNGDTGAGKYVTRHTLFTSEYKDYK